MRILLNWRFWISLIASLGALTGVGLLIANLIVQPPPEYFRSTYFEFALPHEWTIERHGDEAVCVPPGEGTADAIIILAAKERSGDDNIEQYREHLEKPRPLIPPEGEPLESKVIYVREIVIGDHQWIDALHFESEVPGFYTRYLATITSHLGLAATFTAGKDVFDERNEEFESSIESLEIYQSPAAID